MPYWNQEQMQQLLNEHNEQQLFEIALSLAKQLGMDFLGFTIRRHVATQSPQYILLNNFPSEWNTRYQQGDYIKIDPIATHCQQSLAAILWDENAFAEVPEYWEEAQSFGLRFGWSLAIHDARGNQSMLSVLRANGPITTAEFFDKACHTLWLCNLIHTLIVERIHPPKRLTYELSAREIEVLKWSAEGKTAADIACILALSESTVNFHIRSVMAKMNTNNKTSAVVRAAMNGLL